MESDWQSRARCRKDENPHRWLSLDSNDIFYAKQECMKCEVRLECLSAAIYKDDDFIGVNGGISEIEYLIRTWEYAGKEDETNWPRTDRLIQELFREIA